MEPLLTLEEVSKILHVSKGTLRNWDKKGILKAVRIGEKGERRYRKEDVDKIIDQNVKIEEING